MKRAISALLIALAVVLPMVGISVFSWAQAHDPQALAPKPTAVLQQPNPIDDDGATEATITVTFNPAVTVNAPNWTGIITRVDVAAGSSVSTGTPLLAIDGVTRLAAATASPFYRMLAEGMQGDDVLQLETLLQQLEYFSGWPDTNYDWITAAAVRNLESDLGIAQPSGGFDPSWFIWIPGEGLAVDAVPLAVNHTAPAQGETVFATARSINAITLTVATGAFPFDGATRYVLSQHGTDIATITADSDINAGLLGHLTASEDDSAQSDTRRYAVTIRREQPVRMLAVPAAAVLTGQNGTNTCIFGKTGTDDTDYSARAVTVSNGSLGVSHLAANDELSGFYVLANPLDILGKDAQCPSN